MCSNYKYKETNYVRNISFKKLFSNSSPQKLIVFELNPLSSQKLCTNKLYMYPKLAVFDHCLFRNDWVFIISIQKTGCVFGICTRDLTVFEHRWIVLSDVVGLFAVCNISPLKLSWGQFDAELTLNARGIPKTKDSHVTGASNYITNMVKHRKKQSSHGKHLVH